jgi:hypothetical protein
MKEQLGKKLAYAVQSAIESAFAKHIRHQAGRPDKADGLLDKKYVYCNGFCNHGQSFVYVS